MNEIKNESMFENMKDITISIVTYNSADEIEILLNSIKESSCFEKITTFVVDNNSQDNTVEIIENKYHWVKIIKNKENLGFGKAHNIVIKKIKSNYHIVVNPDIKIPNDTIEKSIDFMEKNKDIAIMSPLVLNTDGTQQFLPKKNPSIKYMIGGLFEKYSKHCKNLRDEYTLKNIKIDNPIEIQFCTGAFMVTRTEMLTKIGGFDERYFLHFEDADLTRELSKVGRAIYNPNVKVIHKWHRENKKINKSFFIALKSMFIYMKKWK